MTFFHHFGLPPRKDPKGTSRTLEFTITSDGKPLAGALTFLVTQCDKSGEQHVHNAVANAAGHASISYPAEEETPLYVSAMAAEGTWYGATKQVEDQMHLECPPLDFKSPIEWWHRAVGIERYDPSLGQGIKVGLVDSGVGPHPYLQQVQDLGAIIDGKFGKDGQDVSYHGTMMAGLIAARPTDPKHPCGIAPGVSLSSIRVYPSASEGAQPDDVAEAILFFALEVGVDLINLSLSSSEKSEAQEKAIQQAYEKGTLCIAAAGNQADAVVRYPAAFNEVIAVSASGRDVHDLTPEANATFRPDDTSMIGPDGSYLIDISNYGKGLACIAPGAAIASTVASKTGAPLYSTAVGTSDSVAITTGVVAALLGHDAHYAGLKRGPARADYAAKVLHQACCGIGIAPLYQGQGTPTVTSQSAR